jgi:hypothetical protein
VIQGPVSLTQSVYYAKNIAPAAAGTNIVTMKFNGVAVYPDIRILEYSGIDRVSPVDVTATGAGLVCLRLSTQRSGCTGISRS